MYKGFQAALMGCACAAAALWAAPVRAQTAPLRFTYEAEGACPEQDAFEKEVYSRARRIRPALESDHPWLVKVVVRGGEGQATGTVRVDGPDGTSTTREMRADKCAEVVSALALVVALAVDPYSSAADSASSTPAAIPMPRRRAGTVRVEQPPSLADDPFADQPEEAPRSRPRSAPAWNTGVGYAAMSAVGPVVLTGPETHLAWEPSDKGLFAPRIRASLLYMLPAVASIDSQSAKVAWMGARVSACPLRFSAAGAVLMPCASVAAGASPVQGLVRNGKHLTLGWVDVGVGLQGQLAIGGRFLLEFRATAIAPLTRYTISFDDPPMVFHRTPSLGGEGAVGLAMLFP